MTVDNFDYLASLMTFDSPDDFYFVQVFVRKKDGNNKNSPDGRSINGNNKNRLVRIWTIRSKEELIKAKRDIIGICNATNARAYIHPTKRSFKGVAKECLRLCTESFITDNYEGLKGAYSSACGISYKVSDKKWIVDIDNTDINVLDIIRFIDDECDKKGTPKYLYSVKTVHGCHLICKPFNLAIFKAKYPDIDVHKNNPTLLYYENDD